MNNKFSVATWLTLLKARLSTVLTFGVVAWKTKPLYVLSSLSLFSWGVIMLFSNHLIEVYAIYSFLPSFYSSGVYFLICGAWPVLFYMGQFKAARMIILAQGLVHLTNGLNFLPSIIFDFPGAMTGATIYIVLGLQLIQSWRDTPLILAEDNPPSDKTYARLGKLEEPA